MPSEMLSGPDLGAGFLHQLTTDRNGERTTFTYHAQEGGRDANGPPKGPLDALGFVHPPTPCQFGGPRCWHRRFLLPFSETSKVRQCYNRNRFVLQTMIDQAYEGRPAAIAPALADIRERLAPTSSGEGGEWYVAGSTAAWLLGAPVVPREIGVGASRSAIDRIGTLLVDYLIEPTGTTDWPGVGIVRGARAFVGTFASGARVEWGIPLEPTPAKPLDEWGGAAGGARLLTVSFQSGPIRVTRPEYALVRAVEQRGVDASAPLAEWVRQFGVDQELLDALLERSGLASAGRASLRRRVGA